MRSAIAIVCLVLSGCVGMGLQGAQMTPEQLAAVAKDSNANATALQYTGAGGQAIFTTLNTDRGSLGTNGGRATVKPNGEIEVVVNPRQEPTVKPAPVTCARVSYERAANGTCHQVERDSSCLVRSIALIDTGKCPP